MHWTDCLENGGPKQSLHAAAAVGNTIYTFGDTWNKGGRSPKSNIEVFCLDTGTMEWFEVEYDETTECPKNCRRLSVVAFQHFIFLWGGIDDYLQANPLFCFDTTTLTWSKPTVSGQVPYPRACHTACVIGHYMYIFGGYHNLSISFLNTVYRLNLITFEWEEVFTSGIPPRERRFHSVCVVDDRMFLFGGMGMDRAGYHYIILDDFSYLDTISMRWVTPKCTGRTPCGRFSHTAVVCNNEMYVIGGHRSFSKKKINELNDVWKFNPNTHVWTQITAKGRRPCPRSEHCCVAIGDRLFLFGGKSTRRNFLRNYDHCIVHQDLHVLDFSPNLKILCAIKINDFKIDVSHIPNDLQKEIKDVDDSLCYGWNRIIDVRYVKKKQKKKNRKSPQYRTITDALERSESSEDANDCQPQTFFVTHR
ncbi:Kelch domain-containing protein 3 [Argiope bruennichi]|uniref:Rab9 effector protein with kelch motifs n=1 Tax=Argiope bruennichi TaxID=94029 RepID=A0A8T0ENL3_ARGBR|nr:Kelch domain-containing protein 3 [Argiope bruennichi]